MQRIPDSLRDFINTLRPVRKPGTCDAYFYELRDFHRFVSQQQVDLGDLDRTIMMRWLESLAERGIVPGSRAMRICHVRSYLRWLFEQEELPVPPEDLLRPSDFPKIPDTLPKPFPIEADREMQRRFFKSNDIYGQALFLMRRSGVRIGELVHLVPGCLETDLHDHAFLKVPLGKLNNERLVPLDAKSQSILKALQKSSPQGVPFLLAPHLTRRRVKDRLRETLRQSADGLDLHGPVIPHRLRHSYATELLNAGMSLVGIMKLLGHRSLRMTMRYAAITQESIVKDYYSAMDKIAAKYRLPNHQIESDGSDPRRMLQNTIYWLKKNFSDSKRTPRLIKRLYKIQNEIACLSKQPAIQ